MARQRQRKEAAIAAAAQLLGRKGGEKGGPARARVLSAEQRHRIAVMGGKARKAQAEHKHT